MKTWEPLDLTIVIAVKDGADYLRNCVLSTILANDEIQIILVDDGSTDDTPRIIEELKLRYKTIETIQFPTNRGIGPARNAGLSLVKTSYVSFIDVDSTVGLGWYRAMSDFFDFSLPRDRFGGYHIENVGAVASTVYFMNNKEVLNGSGGDISKLGYGVDRHFGELRKMLNYEQVAFAMGNGMLFRTSLLRAIGGFNEKIKYGYDDVDVCSRIITAGFKVITNPGAVIFHDMGHSSKNKSASQRIFEIELNRLRFVARNYSSVEYLGFILREIKNWLRANSIRKLILGRVYLYFVASLRNTIFYRIKVGTKRGRQSLIFTPLFKVFKGHAAINAMSKVESNLNQFLPVAGFFELEKTPNGDARLWCSPRSKHLLRSKRTLSLSRFSVKPAPGIEFFRLSGFAEKFDFDATLKLDPGRSNIIYIPSFGKSELYINSAGYQEPLLGGRELGLCVQEVTSLDTEFQINFSNKKKLLLSEEIGAHLNLLQVYKVSQGDRKLTLMQLDGTYSTVTVVQYTDSIDAGTFTTHKFRPDGRMEIEITGQNILFIAPCIELVTGSILLEDIQYYG